MNIDVPLALLKAALVCTAKEDVRFYITGVCIDRGHVVATDGHRMIHMQITPEIGESHRQIIIPAEAIDFLAKKVAKEKTLKRVPVTVNIDVLDFDCTLSIGDGLIVEHTKLIDGKYPDWKRVIPKSNNTGKDTPEVLLFNWTYMADFAKCATILGGGKYPAVELEPTFVNQAAFVRFPKTDYEAAGVIMPMRG